MGTPTTAVPAMAMLPAVVQVKAPSGMIVNDPPAKPTGMVKPVIAAVPVTWKRGPLGRMAPAAEATAAVMPLIELGLFQPGTQTPVSVL